MKRTLANTKRELKKLEKQKRKFYHCCCRNKTTGASCPATRFDSSDISKHLKRKMHHPEASLKEDSGKLPADVFPCTGSSCNLCNTMNLCADQGDQVDVRPGIGEDEEVASAKTHRFIKPYVKNREIIAAQCAQIELEDE